MQTSNALAVVLADAVIVGLTIAALTALVLAVWLVVIVALSAARRITPRKRPSSSRSAGTSD